MNFYTVVLRQSAGYWVALCLENGIVGQGVTQDEAIEKLQAAIESLQAINGIEFSVLQSPVAINELHEFLTLETKEPTSEVYEFRAVYA
ncbi:MAG: type II toxin-antitoxin system HicB family antitoxin [Verrucomicrobia bacterium]|nr:type II toxin-antitoxin system HicB family antitoxin [Leptolyngbya sp. ES-bin-22]